jgi:hypothetical protein
VLVGECLIRFMGGLVAKVGSVIDFLFRCCLLMMINFDCDIIGRCIVINRDG